jgi:hypothetical protein
MSGRLDYCEWGGLRALIVVLTVRSDHKHSIDGLEVILSILNIKPFEHDLLKETCIRASFDVLWARGGVVPSQRKPLGLVCHGDFETPRSTSVRWVAQREPLLLPWGPT